MSNTEVITDSKDLDAVHSTNFRYRLSAEGGNLYKTIRSDGSIKRHGKSTGEEKDADFKETRDDIEEDDTQKKSTSGRKHKKHRHPRNFEKTTFMCTSAFMVILSHAVLSFQWLLPYMYLIVTPFVIGIRLAMYWKKQWQHFMLDFCYYANIICIVFLFMPDDPLIFSVMFSLSTGPLMWAIFVYQKSLVLHRIDKVTSTYLHMLPPLISFSMRWYPKDASKYWFREFLQDTDNLPLSWTYLVPFTVFMCYSVIYAIVDNFLWDHKDGHTTIRKRQDIEHGVALHSLFFCVDERCRCLRFYIRVWIFCLITMIGCQFCLYSYTANYIFVAGLGLVAVWNGGSYYVHVFSVKGFSEEKEDMNNI